MLPNLSSNRKRCSSHQNLAADFVGPRRLLVEISQVTRLVLVTLRFSSLQRDLLLSAPSAAQQTQADPCGLSVKTTTAKMAPSFLNHVIFRPPPFETYFFRTKLIRLTTSKGNTIAATHIKRTKSAITLIFSHANGDDLNNCYAQMLKISHSLNVNVIGYDYSGYGKSTGMSILTPCHVEAWLLSL